MQQLYVSASRAWERLRLYTDDKAEVRDAIQRDSGKMLALDLKPAATPEMVEQEKREKRRLDDIERRRRLSVLGRVRAAWGKPTPTRPLGPPQPPRPSGHAGREQARKQERDRSHGR